MSFANKDLCTATPGLGKNDTSEPDYKLKERFMVKFWCVSYVVF